MGALLPCPGAGWTMGALASSTSGIPFALPIDGNTAGEHESFLPGAVGLGEILQQAGYQNYFMCGSDGDFGGRKMYFEGHGDYQVLDYYTALEERHIPEGYSVYWGMEDERLYEWAKIKLSEISREGRPFNFTMLTVDTHHPQGYVCTLCGDEYEDQFGNILSCADRQVFDFISWIQRQDWYEDTVIVVSGDHLSMKNDFWDDLPEGYQRRVYHCFINAQADEGLQTKNRKLCSLDMFPTTLGAMGVKIEHNRLGLGTNLFSGEKSLMEIMGEEVFSNELGKYSAYYENHFIKGNAG